ncbi:MAG: hypothetical protein ABIO76_09910, partial [Ginsengibacter sp.]
MKKIAFLASRSTFVLIFCLLFNVRLYSQIVQAEKFNFTEIANIDVSQLHQRNIEKEIDGGWKPFHDMPLPPNAKIMRQNSMTPFTPATIEVASPPPLQNFLGHIDPM